LENQELEFKQNAKIERMIFHIIGPGLKAPEILEEVEDPSIYEQFFLERLDETAKGTSYSFNSASGVEQQVKTALSSKHAFVDCSEILAHRFQEMFDKDARLIAGVIMFFKIKTPSDTYAAIIKYDDIRVISYKTQLTDQGKKRPILDIILNTFVQDRKALQKSAIINTTNESKIICIDRSGKNGDITDKFRQFLDAQREFDHSTLTDRLLAATVETIKKNKGILPQHLTKRLKSAAREALSAIKNFDPKKPESLLAALFGNHPEMEKLKETFERELKKQKIHNEKVEIDHTKIGAKKKLIRETHEGIRIIYEQEHIDNKLIEFYEKNGEHYFKGKTIEYNVDDEYNGKN